GDETLDFVKLEEEEIMAGVGPMTQDWEPVVIRKRAPNSAAKRDEKTVNAARRSGADIESVRKCLQCWNQQGSLKWHISQHKEA
ncbi:hypothetical protein F2Q70_00008752, partial [Brassica cretica]